MAMLASLRPRMSSSVSGVAPGACAPVSAITLGGGLKSKFGDSLLQPVVGKALSLELHGVGNWCDALSCDLFGAFSDSLAQGFR
jgi:hypothetical protein